MARRLFPALRLTSLQQDIELSQASRLCVFRSFALDPSSSPFQGDALTTFKVCQVSGIPEKHLHRKVCIFSPARTTSQQGTAKTGSWRINFISTQKYVFGGPGMLFSSLPTESRQRSIIMQLQRGKRPLSRGDEFGNPSKENASMFKTHKMDRKGLLVAQPSISHKQLIGEEEKKQKVKKNEPATRPANAKASTLVHMILPLSSVKEEVYNALDSWSAWDYKFPMVAVKKALKILKDKQQWPRIIQVSKWMLSKGQGKTLGTYDLLIQALDEDGRLEEAEVVWTRLVLQNIESVPRMMYARMISIYEKRGMFDKLLKVFKDMEDMSVKPDEGTVDRVARTYEKLGLLEKKERHLQRYSKAVTERNSKAREKK